MFSFYIQLVFLFLISYNYVSGLSKLLPHCQCECCPGAQCQSQLLIFSVDTCNEKTCSFERCYKMYPKICGLTPGITNTSCSIVSAPATTVSYVTISLLSNVTSCNVILPMMIIMNLLFFCLFKHF
ncbi:unnamed protein product [Rotaria sp. Silwood2]|nr:unnamed protein product [Rotaria sp. Silwood2]CAF2964668.1 unnamed protein product [Rotaria sp. Silwood2]CAF4437970.1 unnamed protein product [Rotaria sp. Silwood2]CAF4482776.1 unnamed protein product [Rotaria sp. Silwood2]